MPTPAPGIEATKQPSIVAVAIMAGESLSDSVDVSVGSAAYVLMPGDWDGANLTFQVSFDDVTYWDVFDEVGNEIMYACRAGTAVRIKGGLQSVGYFKIRSGTSDAPVVQSEDRNFKVVFSV